MWLPSETIAIFFLILLDLQLLNDVIRAWKFTGQNRQKGNAREMKWIDNRMGTECRTGTSLLKTVLAHSTDRLHWMYSFAFSDDLPNEVKQQGRTKD